MPLPAGEDQRRSLRPRPANCSPAMIIACGRDRSFSVHSGTMRVSIIERSLVLLKLFQSSAQLRLLRLRSGNDVRGRVAHEAVVAELGLDGLELLLRLLDVAAQFVELLLRDLFLRELDGDVD